MTEIEKLQFVLDLFKSKKTLSVKDIQEEYKKLYFPCMDIFLVRSIVDKLRKDGYIKPYDDAHDDLIISQRLLKDQIDSMQFVITYEGSSFAGYTEEEKTKKSIKKATFWGTFVGNTIGWVAKIFTGCYIGWVLFRWIC